MKGKAKTGEMESRWGREGAVPDASRLEVGRGVHSEVVRSLGKSVLIEPKRRTDVIDESEYSASEACPTRKETSGRISCIQRRGKMWGKGLWMEIARW